MVGNKQVATEKNLGKRPHELRLACQVSVDEFCAGPVQKNPGKNLCHKTPNSKSSLLSWEQLEGSDLFG